MKMSKRQQFWFTPIICAIMVLFMTVFVMAAQEGGLDRRVLLRALAGLPLAYAFALAIELAFISKAAKKFAWSIVKPEENSPLTIILATSFCMVSCMSFCMSWFGAVSQFGFSTGTAPFFLHTWPRNFLVALFFQWLIAGPAARRLIQKLA